MSSEKNLSKLDCLNNLETVLQERLLTYLTEKKPADLRNDLQDVSEKLYFIYTIVDCLRGLYSNKGIRMWFQRERIQLEGKSPLQYLSPGWSPDKEEAKCVLELAKSSLDAMGT